MEEEKPTLDRMSFTFTQEANCLTTGDQIETLEVEVESSLGIDRDKGGFLVLRTKQWSCNDSKELKSLLDRVEAALKAVVEKE